MPHTLENGFVRLKSPVGKGIILQRCVSRKQSVAGSFPTSSKTVSAFSLTVSGIRPTPEPCRRHGENRTAFRLDRRPTTETRPFHRPFRPGGQNRDSGRTKTESVLPMCAISETRGRHPCPSKKPVTRSKPTPGLPPFPFSASPCPERHPIHYRDNAESETGWRGDSASGTDAPCYRKAFRTFFRFITPALFHSQTR